MTLLSDLLNEYLGGINWKEHQAAAHTQKMNLFDIIMHETARFIYLLIERLPNAVSFH